MPKKTPNILYSTNCLLAYRIGAEFYDDLHYVWCSTAFGSPGIEPPLFSNPRSSAPYERYSELKKDIETLTDGHSNMVASLKAGIKGGANTKFSEGKITEGERDEIIEMVDAAKTPDFQPLMYLVPYDKVKGIAKRVPVLKRANPMSDEWIIEELPRESFDIVRF